MSGIVAVRLFKMKMVSVSTKDDTVLLPFLSSQVPAHNTPDSTTARQPMP